MKLTSIKPAALLLWTCLLLFLAPLAQAQNTVVITNILKREVWFGVIRQQIETNGVPASTNVSFPGAWDIPNDATANYGARLSGVIIPTNTALYDFYVASDDDSSLWIGTNELAAGKYQIAQEDGWSAPLSWLTTGGGGSISSQKGSITWTNALGVAPYSGGILLSNGFRYYLELAYHSGPFLPSQCAVTMVPHGAGISDGQATTLTNTDGLAVIGVVTATNLTLVATTQPTNRTVYPGMTAFFRAGFTHTSVAVPPSFIWQRGTVAGGVTNYVNIPTATNSIISSASISLSLYSLVASTNDNGARFRCIAKVPGIGPSFLSRTSSVVVLTVPFSGGMIVSNRLKRELFTGMNSGAAVTTITNGNNNFPAAINAFASFDIPSAGINYGERVNGYFTPTATDRYVFFLASDDNAVLMVSTNDQPVGKVLVAQEDGASDPRDWYGVNAVNGSISTQKRSDTWSPDAGTTTPYAGGIPMTAGTRYYIEAVHWGGGGNNHLGVTVATTNDVFGGLPLNLDPSTLTNGVISYLTSPVTTFAITNQPQSVTRTEGETYTFSVGIRTDSEVNPAYQWKKNGVNINGAVTATYTGTALTVDSNAVFACAIDLPGVTNTASSNAVLTVLPGSFAEGFFKREIWTNDTTTRMIVGANVGGTFPLAQVITFVEGFNITTDYADMYVDRISGFFVPPATTNYVFFLACDNDADLYISYDQQAANKFMIAQETGRSGPYNWTASVESSNPQKRSDQWNNGAYSGGIRLTNGQRYYIEIVHHDSQYEDSVTATYIISGEPDPINGAPGQLTGSNVGVLVPKTTVMNVTTNPVDVTTYGWEPVYFRAFATNDNPFVAPTYQWRRGTGPGNMTNLIGVTGNTFGFITSTNDNGAKFDCVIKTAGASSLTKTSSVATLTLVPGPTFTPGSLKRERWDGAFNRLSVETGASGPAQTNDTIAAPLVGGSPADNFVQRFRGFFLPPETTNYVFFVAADNDTDVFLGTDDQPRSKVLLCQEQAWCANNTSWNSALGGGIAYFKRSDQFATNSTGTGTASYTNGIPLIAGQRYYFEVVWHEGGGGDFLGITYKHFNDADPADGTLSVLTGAVFAHMEAPVVVVPPVLTATASGGLLTVSWTPTGGTLQSTTDLSPPVTWNTVGTINPTNLVIGPGRLFLRVTVP
jgi:PA14 domain